DTREEMCELWSLGQAESRLRALWPEGPEGSRPPGPHPLGARRERSTLPQPAEATGFVPPTARCSGSRSFRGPTTPGLLVTAPALDAGVLAGEVAPFGADDRVGGLGEGDRQPLRALAHPPRPPLPR